MNEEPAYSVAKSTYFNWQSMSGDLNREKVAFLDEHLAEGRVLDVGCGGGAYVAHLQGKGYEAEGVDTEEEFLAFARKEHPSCRFTQGSATALPFPDNAFSSIVLFDVLEHVDDDVAALRELGRVARSRILLTVPLVNNPLLREGGITFAHYEDLTHRRYYTSEMLREHVACAGLRVATLFEGLALHVGPVVARFLDDKGLINGILRRLLHGKLRVARYKEIATTIFAVIATS